MQSRFCLLRLQKFVGCFTMTAMVLSATLFPAFAHARTAYDVSGSALQVSQNAPAACSNPITSLLNMPGLVGFDIYEQSSGPTPEPTAKYSYAKNDVRLIQDIAQGPGNADLDTGLTLGEKYDFFVSNAAGQLDPTGAYFTVEAWTPGLVSNVGNNIDAIELVFSNGTKVAAGSVPSMSIGVGGNAASSIQGVGFHNGFGTNGITFGGNGYSRFTFGGYPAACGDVQCNDGIDNDGDGATDFPNDFSCDAPTDNDETNQKSQCQDGIDNDGDGKFDAVDAGCVNAQDNDESDQISCRAARIIYIDLQPNPPLIPSEEQGLVNLGYNVTFYNRNSLPTITSSVLNKNNFDISYFHNGCGGNTGLLSSAELAVIRSFYLAGGSLSLTADDAYGDTGHGQQRLGNCTARVNQIAGNLGIQFSGTLDNTAGGACQAVTTTHPIFTGEKIVGRNTDALITFTNSAAWGGTLPSSIAILNSTAQVAIAFTPAQNGHGSVVFNTNETGLLSCGPKRTENYVNLLNFQKSCNGTASQCSDGVDNDGDGAVDFPNDFSCSSATDTDETNPKAQCQDGVDNDGDGLSDFSQDSGCASKQDNDETNGGGGAGVDLQATISVPPQNHRGTNLTQILGVKNLGSVAVASAVLKQPIPAGYVFVPASSNPACTSDTAFVTCPVSNLAPGASIAFQVALLVPATTPCGSAATFQDTVTTTSATDTNPANNTASGNVLITCPDGPPPAPQCSDGIDNDNDGATDFPNDFSCGSSSDNDEANPKAQCQDGVDNDADGATDFPQDSGCSSNQDNNEFTQPTLFQCQDGIDNDNDGAVDFPNDFSCSAPTDNDETNPKSQCQDGIDNDGDGQTDFPGDPGCTSKQDDGEFNAPPPPAGADLAVSLDIDPQINRGDNMAEKIGVQNVGSVTVPSATVKQIVPTGLGYNAALSDPACAFNGVSIDCTVASLAPGQSKTFVVFLTIPSTWPCDSIVNKQATVTAIGVTDINAANNTASDSFRVTCGGNPPPPAAQCQDGIDNDNDGAADFPNDFSCDAPTDNDETNPKSQCQDGVDNDADGLVDFPQDPGCASKQDNIEFNQPVAAQCQDGIDNDNDGATDFPSDFSCSSPTDNDETFPKAQCQDGIDNDGDGFVDVSDQGCVSLQDDSEFNAPPVNADLAVFLAIDPQINRGDNMPEKIAVQNVGSVAIASSLVTQALPAGLTFNSSLSSQNCSSNGVTVTCTVGNLAPGQSTVFWTYLTVSPSQACNSTITKQATVSTTSAVDGNSSNNTSTDSVLITCSGPPPPTVFQCNDGIDNDGDGATDSADFSCSSATDNDETNPKSQCQDGFDNDGDGAVDFPQDAGCSSKQDNDESNAAPAAQCQDGIDNDGDGLVDFPQDPGCSNAQDTDESNSSSCPNPTTSLLNMPGLVGFDIYEQSSGPTPEPTAKYSYAKNDVRLIQDIAQGPGNADLDTGLTFGEKYDFFVSNSAGQLDSSGPCFTVQAFTPGPVSNVGNNIDAIELVFSNGTKVPAGSAPSMSIGAGGSAASAIQGVGFHNGFGTNGITFGGNGYSSFTFCGFPPVCALAQCQDGIDNDGDGFTDLSDFSCSAATDNDETNPKSQCQDGVDNDGDGKADAVDPGCVNSQDNDEFNSAPPAQCSDGVDNDGDGLVDSSDPGCVNSQDNDETNGGGAAVDLSVTLSLPPQVNRGFDLPETIVVKNVGTTTVASAKMIQPPPGDFLFSDLLSSDECTSNGTEVTCIVPSLAPGESKTFMVFLRVVSDYRCNTPFTKSANVSTTAGTDTNMSNNSATATTMVTCLP
ncbi:MAG: hypothetical protein HOO67_06890 [Candidatus Peribacteraceae bacterium]|nr:hypothetical protein [Candidatus Peribacteraceae bacterium]